MPEFVVFGVAGLNDVTTEIFGLADAEALLVYCHAQPRVKEIAMWSISRDRSTGVKSYVEPSASSIAQRDFAFTDIFKGYTTVTL